MDFQWCIQLTNWFGTTLRTVNSRLRAKGIFGAVLYIQYQNKIQIILYIQDPIS